MASPASNTAPPCSAFRSSWCSATASAAPSTRPSRWSRTARPFPGHLPSLINAIRPAVIAAQAKQPADLLAEATAENVRLDVKSLMVAKPILSELVTAGKLKIVAGAVYDIATGKVMPV